MAAVTLGRDVPKACFRSSFAVTFSGEGTQLFKGLYVQARTPEGRPVGHFRPSDDEHVRLSSCGDGQNVSTANGNPTSHCSKSVHFRKERRIVKRK